MIPSHAVYMLVCSQGETLYLWLTRTKKPGSVHNTQDNVTWFCDAAFTSQEHVLESHIRGDNGFTASDRKPEEQDYHHLDSGLVSNLKNTEKCKKFIFMLPYPNLSLGETCNVKYSEFQ